MVDFDQLRQLMLQKLLAEPGWHTFQSLAGPLCGDPECASVLASIAKSYPRIFVVDNAEKRVKLAVEVLRAAQPTVEGLPQLVARAVQAYAGQLHPISINVVEADSGRRVLERFLHQLRISEPDDDLRIADDTPVELQPVSGQRNSGYVAGLGQDNQTIYVALAHQILQADLPAKLVVYRNRTWLDMAQHLFALGSAPELFGALLREWPGAPLQRGNSRLLGLDLQYLKPPWARLLWGPPGAGKTFCLASLSSALSALTLDERVLIVAHSNVAIDVATIKVVESLKLRQLGTGLIDQRRVLRYGYPRDQRILGMPEILGPLGLEGLSHEIEKVYEELRRLKRNHAPEMEVAAAQTLAKQLGEERKKRMAAHVSAARIVTTTVSAVVSANCPILQSGPWHTVILDEASMANAALVMFLASLATRRLLLAGDPRQLGPVFEWNAYGGPPLDVQRWLAQDPYETAGLSTGEGLDKVVKTDDGRVARIVNQRRCHPALWTLVSTMYPGVEPQIDLRRLDLLANLSPQRGSALANMDVGSSSRLPQRAETLEGQDDDDVAWKFESGCKPAGRSWKNPPTAMLAIDIVRELRAQLSDVSIAIVSPYRGQARLIRRWLDEETRADAKLKDVEVGTVHAFQGGESDVVIFDIVDGPPRRGLGALLRGDLGTRLVNVAITRARGKLVLIAHRAWFQANTNQREAGLLWKILLGNAPSALCKVLPPSDDDRQPGEPRPESPIEEILWLELQRRQSDLPPFVLQHRIGDLDGRIISRADFAFVAEKLAVYCDGGQFHLNPSQWKRDLGQRRRLAALGWFHFAFTGSEIMADNGFSSVQEIVRYFALRQK